MLSEKDAQATPHNRIRMYNTNVKCENHTERNKTHRIPMGLFVPLRKGILSV